MASLLHRVVYEESDWLNIRNTKAYKNYVSCQSGADLTNKALYLNWVTGQIRDRALDGRHLIASAKCAGTQKFISIYADTAFAKELENRLERVSADEALARASTDLAVSAGDIEPVAKPILDNESVDEPVDEPVAESVDEPVAESVDEPVAESVAESVAEPVAGVDDTDVYKLRFVHSEDWRKIDGQTRQALDSKQSNRIDGQLLVLHKLPNLVDTHVALFDYLFITSLATEATRKDPMYAHVAQNGSVIFSAASADDSTLPIFRIKHGDVISDTCINTAVCVQDEKSTIYNCTFPSSHMTSMS